MAMMKAMINKQAPSRGTPSAAEEQQTGTMVVPEEIQQQLSDLQRQV